MKGVLLSGVTAALLLGGGIASAADLYRAPAAPAAVPAVPYVYSFSWTGFYIGVNVGYGCCGDDQVGLFSNVTGRIGSPGTLEINGIFGGVQAGYNWQFGGLVLGVETDFQGSDINDTINNKRFLGGILPTHASSEVNWFGTVRGRVGFAWDRVLVYGTGGFAYGDVDYNVRATNITTNPRLTGRISDNDIYTGFAVGGGIEVAWAPNWTTKLEYQYVNLGQQDLSGPVINTQIGERIRTAATPDFHSVRLGLNWKFGYEPAPPPPAAAVVKY